MAVLRMATETTKADATTIIGLVKTSILTTKISTTVVTLSYISGTGSVVEFIKWVRH